MVLTKQRLTGLALLLLALLVLGIAQQEQLQAFSLWQSPLPTVTIPPDDEADVPEDEMAESDEIDNCATKRKTCITFAYLGHETAADGTTTLQFRITNHCNQQLRWVEIVSRQWQRLEPSNEATYLGDRGEYSVTWINDAPEAPRRNGYRYKNNRIAYPGFQSPTQDSGACQGGEPGGSSGGTSQPL